MFIGPIDGPGQKLAAAAYSGTQRTTFSWPWARVAIVPSGQDVWLPAAGIKPPLQRMATWRVPPQTRRPLETVQAAVTRVVVPRCWAEARLAR